MYYNKKQYIVRARRKRSKSARRNRPIKARQKKASYRFFISLPRMEQTNTPGKGGKLKTTDSDLQEILTHAWEAMKEEGAKFELNQVNRAELARRTNISRHKLRKLKRDGFVVRENGNKGRKAETTVMTGFTGVVDNLLKNGVVNSEVIMAKIRGLGYEGSRSSLKNYISGHRD